MLVRLTEDVELDFDGQTVEFAAGMRVGTPLADHMVKVGLPVTVVDATLDPAAVVTGTDTVVLDWVGDDPDRAALALEAERALPAPRADLVAVLEAITAG